MKETISPTRRGCALHTGTLSMREYNLYVNMEKPAVVLYVRAGAGLADLANPNEWVFDGTAADHSLPPGVVKGVEASGHASRDID
jgi:hypothetical protein